MLYILMFFIEIFIIVVLLSTSIKFMRQLDIKINKII